MTWIVCGICGAVVAPDGIEGIVPHLIAFHPESAEAQFLMSELARMPLPEPA